MKKIWLRAEQKREDKSVLIARNALMLMQRIYTLHKLVIKPSLLSTGNKLLRQMKDEFAAAYRFSAVVVFVFGEIYWKKEEDSARNWTESSKSFLNFQWTQKPICNAKIPHKSSLNYS